MGLTEKNAEELAARLRAGLSTEEESVARERAEEEGSLPLVRLPGDGWPLWRFASEVGDVMARDGVFLRESMPVVLDPITKRLTALDADCFRSYVERSLTTVKMKQAEEEGRKVWIPVACTMNREMARGVLASHDFVKRQRQVDRVARVPVPVLRPWGDLVLLGAGYDEESRTLVVEE